MNLIKAESAWSEPHGPETKQLVCDNCQASGRSIATKCGNHADRWEENHAFQVYFEGDVVYFICSTCAQVLDPVKIKPIKIETTLNLIEGQTYLIGYDGDGDKDLAYTGPGIFTGKTKEIEGLCGGFRIPPDDKECWFPTTTVYPIGEK